MFSPLKNLWKLTIGSAGRLRFHIALDEGSVSLRRETARLYRAQLAFFNILLEPTTVLNKKQEQVKTFFLKKCVH